MSVLNDIAADLLRWMFHAGWQATLVAIAAALLLYTTRSRTSSQLRYAVLLIVLAKFAMPPFTTAPTGVFSQGNPATMFEVIPVTTGAGVVDSPAEAGAAEVRPQLANATALSTSKQTVEGSVAPSSSGEPFSWQLFVAAVYFLGAATAVVRLLRHYLRLRYIVRNGDAVAPLASEAERLCKMMGLKSVPQILATGKADSPFATGLWRCYVVLPSELLESLPQGQIRIILAHELAHIRRRDLLVGALEAVLGVVWWFHPAMWWLQKAIRRTREECCDDLLVAGQLADPERYCETLIEAAARQTLPIAEPLALGFSSTEHPAAQRIRRLMDSSLWRTDRLRRPAIILTILLGVVLLPGMQPDRAPVIETTLEGVFGWRNLPFDIDDAEEEAVKECNQIAQNYFNTRNDERVFDNVVIRQQLEALLKERPKFFYAQQLLATWHRRNGDPEVSQRLTEEALRNAPIVLTRRYRRGNGEPIRGLEIPRMGIECNRVQKGSLDPSLKVKYSGLITDENGEIHIPVYDTVYRVAEHSYPSGYEVAPVKSLGWFESKSRVGELPDVVAFVRYSRPRDFTRRSSELPLLRDGIGTTTQRLDAGENTWVLATVARAQGDETLVVEDGRGKTQPAAAKPLPKLTNTTYMDHAVIDLSEPQSDHFDIDTVRILDAQTKIPIEKFQSGAGYRQVGSHRFHAFSLWETLPESVDLVLKVHNYGADYFRYILPARVGATATHNGTTLSIPHLIAGHHQGWSSTTGFHGEPKQVSTTSEVQLTFVGNPQQRFSVWVALRNGRKWNMKSGGWFSGAVVGGGGWSVTAALDEIDHFELLPYVEPEIIFFENIQLPKRAKPLDENTPIVEFPVDGLEREFDSDVFSPLRIHFASQRGRVYSGIGSSPKGISFMERARKGIEPNKYTTVTWQTDCTVDFDQETVFTIRVDGAAPKKLGRRSSMWAQSVSTAAGVDTRSAPLETLQSAQLYLFPKEPVVP